MPRGTDYLSLGAIDIDADHDSSPAMLRMMAVCWKSYKYIHIERDSRWAVLPSLTLKILSRAGQLIHRSTYYCILFNLLYRVLSQVWEAIRHPWTLLWSPIVTTDMTIQTIRWSSDPNDNTVAAKPISLMKQLSLIHCPAAPSSHKTFSTISSRWISYLLLNLLWYYTTVQYRVITW